MDKATTQKLIKKAGGAKFLSEKLGAITPQAIWQWELVPPKRCLPIQEACDGVVTVHDLRPDIFGDKKIGDNAA